VSEVKLETWEELSATAKQTIDALIGRLPEEVRPEALRIGYQLQNRKRDRPDTLGDYARWDHTIMLYLETIREDCLEESWDFCTEVERTYLHEFGHHLGLNEAEVEKFGL
jgi:hypothetical protein